MSLALTRAAILFGIGLSLLGAAGAAELETATANYQTRPLERVLDGVIEAVHQATVSAQTSGRVISISYDVDDFVEKGAILLQFRDTDQRARFNSARAAFDEASAELTRVKDLFERQLMAQAALDRAQAQYKAAQAALEQATEVLENTRVKAPYSGIMVKRHIEVGELASVGQALFTGLSLEALRVSVELPQDMIRVVRERQQASMIVDGPSPQRVAAESLRISPYADPRSHTFNVRANLPEQDYGIYPGMFVKVAFVLDEVPRLLIPVQAVVHRSEVTGVYVVAADGRLSLRQVRVGERVNEDFIEVLAGLSEGEQVALDPVRATLLRKEQTGARR